MKIFTFDTTLRDGTQGESISFSVEDKLLIAEKLDELGIDYIEGGWPGSNPNDREFFIRARDLTFKHSKLTAFGATRLAKYSVENDPSIVELVAAGTPAVSIFGKSWDLHVHRALGISEEENLRLIEDTVSYLKSHGKEVIYDAEHFFDGYRANSAFALRTLEAAKKAGADVLCLCDTNGGSLPQAVAEIVADVRRRFDGIIGIHCHNDSDVAVANTLAAVQAGATHVQGCINGYGERCGNANLCSIRADQPFVGRSAFAHKGGVHVSAVLKDSSTYEHIKPELVGNRQRVLVSQLSGRGNITYKLKQLGLAEHLSEEARRELLARIKLMEYQGYDFESAEGTFELLVREAINPDFHPFDVVSYEVSTRFNPGEADKLPGSDETITTASVTLRVGEDLHSFTGTGEGPVHALDICLRRCLAATYPAITNVRLTDYKVRVLGSKVSTESKVRVLVEWSDHRRSWATLGVSNNIIDASWRALVDALRLELIRLVNGTGVATVEGRDYSWAV